MRVNNLFVRTFTFIRWLVMAVHSAFHKDLTKSRHSSASGHEGDRYDGSQWWSGPSY